MKNLRRHPRAEGALPGPFREGNERRGGLKRRSRRAGAEWAERRALRERYGRSGSREVLECRLDVALHRSGLRNSIRAGRQVVRAGLVLVNGREARPGQRLSSGDRVTRSQERWPEWAERSRQQFQRWELAWGGKRCRPIAPWLEVDWTVGAFVRVYEPRREEAYA